MAEDVVTEFDLANASPEEAAKLAKARANELAKKRDWAVLGMLGNLPELNRAAATQYGQAEQERQDVAQGMPRSVLHLSLEKLNQQRQLAALQQQIEYQRGQLGLQGQQLGASILAPLIPSLLQSQTSEANIRAIAGLIGGHWGEKLAKTASTLPEAHQKVITDFLKSVGLDLSGALSHPTVPRPKSEAAHKEPAAGPTSEASVMPSTPTKIRVRNKKTHQIGRLSPQFFNEDLYEKVPEE